MIKIHFGRGTFIQQVVRKIQVGSKTMTVFKDHRGAIHRIEVDIIFQRRFEDS